MKGLVLLALLTAGLLSGCDSGCTPSPAYTVPAHWNRGYYSSDQHQNFWTGKWYTVRVYHQPEYVPTTHVPAVVCKK